MVRYIALLQGINVGSRRVPMERLRQIFESLGLINVKSYIASGNIFFDTEKPNLADLSDLIEQKLHDELNFKVPVFIRSTDQIEKIIKLAPFNDMTLSENDRFCVVFTQESISLETKLPVSSRKLDMEIIGINTTDAYVVWHIINGRPPSSKWDPSVLPIKNTSRFFHTLSKILAASKS
jgi:uncharacterized protein (DUF1697 family)